MVRIGITSIVCSLLVGAPMASSAKGQYLPVGPDQVQLRLELVGLAPLPYQAVRLRVSLCNISGRMLANKLGEGNLKSLEADPAVIVGARRVDVLVFDKPRDRYMLDPHGGAEPIWFTRGRSSFRPGECTSLSFAVASTSYDRKSGMTRTPLHDTLFPWPGSYRIKYSYNEPLEAVLNVQVPEPQGDDQKVYALLQEDNVLASAMMSPVDPPGKEVVGNLRALLELYPKSSYADYARFALARYHRYWGDFIPDNPRHSQRVERAIAIDYLRSISHTPERPFPYRSYVIVALRTLDAASRNGFQRELDGQYRDALECLPEIGRSIGVEEGDRLKFRKRAVQSEKEVK